MRWRGGAVGAENRDEADGCHDGDGDGVEVAGVRGERGGVDAEVVGAAVQRVAKYEVHERPMAA